jgi:hypothetical protein
MENLRLQITPLQVKQNEKSESCSSHWLWEISRASSSAVQVYHCHDKVESISLDNACGQTMEKRTMHVARPAKEDNVSSDKRLQTREPQRMHMIRGRADCETPPQ